MPHSFSSQPLYCVRISLHMDRFQGSLSSTYFPNWCRADRGRCCDSSQEPAAEGTVKAPELQPCTERAGKGGETPPPPRGYVCHSRCCCSHFSAGKVMFVPLSRCPGARLCYHTMLGLTGPAEPLLKSCCCCWKLPPGEVSPGLVPGLSRPGSGSPAEGWAEPCKTSGN